jgi:hypothetical protein
MTVANGSADNVVFDQILDLHTVTGGMGAAGLRNTPVSNLSSDQLAWLAANGGLTLPTQEQVLATRGKPVPQPVITM